MSGGVPHRVVVLGGTGLLGAEGASNFAAAGSQVTVVARHLPPGSCAPSGCTPIMGDVADRGLLEALVEKADHVVWAVGSPLPAESNLDPPADLLRTLPPFLLLLDALRQRPAVSLTLFSSGGTVYGEPARLPVTEEDPCKPITSYGVTKLCAEKYLGMYERLYGVRGRVLRVSNAYGSRQRADRGQGVIAAFLAAIRAGRPIHIYGDGSVVRDYVHVADVAQAAVKLAERDDGPSVINVGTGVGHSLRQVLDVVRQVTGADPVVRYDSPRRGDVHKLVLDVSRLSSLVEWHPLCLQDGIARTWEQINHDTELVRP